jgi:hypothetical protein
MSKDKSAANPTLVTPLEAAARAMGITVIQLVAALRDPALWETYGGGFGNQSYTSTFSRQVGFLANTYELSKSLPDNEAKIVGGAALEALKSLVSRGPAEKLGGSQQHSK